ncbi:MAG: hypothetical protein WBW41_20785 [Verrucomicrobiia bacterium]
MNRRRKMLVVVSAVLAVAVLIPVIHHYQLRAATEAYIAELKAKGEPMDLAQIIPPPVPAEQNSAETFRKAAALIDADDSLSYSNYVYGMEMVAPGKAMVRWRQPDVRDSEGTNSWESVEEAVSQNAQSFALLQQIIAKPEFDFQINYNQGVADLNFTNFYLAESKRAAQRLGTAALCDLHQGNTASTVTNLQTMLAIVKAMRNKRLVISELVRIAIANIALTVNWEALQSTNMTDEQLTELQQDWASLDFILNGENTLAMERVIGEITLAKWRSSSLELQHYYFDLGKRAREAMGLPDENGTFWDQTRMTTKTFMWHYWWSYPDELRALRGYEVLLGTVRFAETNHSFQTALNDQESQLAALGIDKLDDEFSTSFDPEKIDMHSTLSQSIVALSGTVRRVMTAETAKEVVITAIALKRCQLKHENYPLDLNSLVPEFLRTIPLDPVDGQPLRYRRNADGTFLLYSVGENGKDDGGDPSLEEGVQSSSFYWQNPHALDWVWPQPATPEEIQNFYAHPPK